MCLLQSFFFLVLFVSSSLFVALFFCTFRFDCCWTIANGISSKAYGKKTRMHTNKEPFKGFMNWKFLTFSFVVGVCFIVEFIYRLRWLFLRIFNLQNAKQPNIIDNMLFINHDLLLRANVRKNPPNSNDGEHHLKYEFCIEYLVATYDFQSERESCGKGAFDLVIFNI